MDASNRLRNKNLIRLFVKIKQQGMVTGEGRNNIAARRKEHTFKRLQEPPCLYRRCDFKATFIAVYQTQFVQEYLIKHWVSYILLIVCILFNHLIIPTLHLRCQIKEHQYPKCQRCDQSVLRIVLNRLHIILIYRKPNDEKTHIL